MTKVKIWDVITRKTRMVEETDSLVTCLDCGRTWDDSIVTGITPTPAARCPFEGMRRLPVSKRHSMEIEK